MGGFSFLAVGFRLSAFGQSTFWHSTSVKEREIDCSACAAQWVGRKTKHQWLISD
jgi:hypothetical protein